MRDGNRVGKEAHILERIEDPITQTLRRENAKVAQVSIGGTDSKFVGN